ncbi:MAG: helix-turn-helix domain-containing protein [bacterium]|nr:helix-turn-helix domain-containing protein [bacterium]
MIKPIEAQLDLLCTIVEAQYGIDREEFLAKSRKREYVNFRRILMVIIKKHTKESLASIGSHLGKKDHATVLHAIRTHEQLMVENHKTRMPVNKEYADMFATIYSEYLSSLDSTFDKVALRNVLLSKIETIKKQVATIDEQLLELKGYKDRVAELNNQ